MLFGLVIIVYHDFLNWSILVQILTILERLIKINYKKRYEFHQIIFYYWFIFYKTVLTIVAFNLYYNDNVVWIRWIIQLNWFILIFFSVAPQWGPIRPSCLKRIPPVWIAYYFISIMECQRNYKPWPTFESGFCKLLSSCKLFMLIFWISFLVFEKFRKAWFLS